MFKHKKELSSWLTPRTGLLSPDITSKDSQDFRVHRDREAEAAAPTGENWDESVKYLDLESKLENCDGCTITGEQSNRNFQLPSLFPEGVFMSTLGMGAGNVQAESSSFN